MKIRIFMIISILGLLPFVGCHKTSVDESAKTATESAVQPEASVEESPKAEEKVELVDQNVVENPYNIEAFVEQPDDSSFDTPFASYTLVKKMDGYEPEERERFYSEIQEVLVKWNKLKNAHDSAKLAKLFSKRTQLGDENYTDKTIQKKLSSFFKENTGYSQTPANRYYVYYNFSTEIIDRFEVKFKQKVTKNGETQDVDMLLVLDRTENSKRKSVWNIVVESDSATELEMIKKLGFKANNEASQKALDYLYKSFHFRNRIHDDYETWTQNEAKAILEECVEGSRYSAHEGFIDPNPNDHKYYFALYSKYPASEESGSDNDWDIVTLGKYTVDLDKGEIGEWGNLIETFNP